MYIRNYDKAEYELTGSKIAADTMVNHVTSLGLSVLGILWSLGKTTKSKVYDLIHRDHTTVSHNVTDLIEDGYVHEQVISRKVKYISLTEKGKELYSQFINKSIALTRELRSVKTERKLAPVRLTIDLGRKEPLLIDMCDLRPFATQPRIRQAQVKLRTS